MMARAQELQVDVAFAELPEAPSAVLRQQASEATPEPQAPNETNEERKARLKAEGDREVKQEESQRILAVVPNFNTVQNGQGVALTGNQKLRLATRAAFDPFNLVGAVFLAGLSEVDDDADRGFGWGPAGFGKRVGANFANTVDGTMLASAAYPILLHQDPRYFRKGAGTVRLRVRHALLAAVICRSDNGRTEPNYSNVAGNFTAGLISNLYYPDNERGVRLSLVNSSVNLVEGALGNVGLEFAPDVAGWWKQRH
jgi:hypothetical protein